MHRIDQIQKKYQRNIQSCTVLFSFGYFVTIWKITHCRSIAKLELKPNSWWKSNVVLNLNYLFVIDLKSAAEVTLRAMSMESVLSLG